MPSTSSIPAPVLDFVDRVGWTFVQALAGSVVSAGTAASLATFDYRAALAGAGSAALLAALKVLAVAASTPKAAETPAPGVPVVQVTQAGPKSQDAPAAQGAPVMQVSPVIPQFTFSAPSAQARPPATVSLPVVTAAAPPLSTEAIAAQSATPGA